MTLPDVQNTYGDFGHEVKAGVSGLKMPVWMKQRDGELQRTIATVDMQVNLPREYRGINMSRLPIILNERYREEWALDGLDGILDEMNKRLGSSMSHIRMEMPYFYTKYAPTSGERGLAHVDVVFDAIKNSQTPCDLILTVKVPVTTLCPCSKEISEASAHNQRALVEISIRYTDFVWIEELISIAENCASCAVYPVLKRPDEKWVTERAYANPNFVEDVSRKVAAVLHPDKRIRTYHVKTTAFESIHQHQAVAEVAGDPYSLWRY